MSTLDDTDWEEFFAGEPDPEPEQHKHLRDRLIGLDGLAALPPAVPLIDGLLYRGTLAQLAGQPGSYKSFLTVGMACSIALGRDWEGHRVPTAGPVVYVAPEGASGLRARVLAWCHLSGVDAEELRGRLLFLPAPLQLGHIVDVSEAVEVASEISAALLVLDTRARCTLGLEENSATDQGRAIDAAERIQRASGASVLGVHHSGRGGDHGRGSNAWDGAVWSDLRVTGEDLKARIKCEKHKDVPDGCEHHYRLVPHTVPERLMPGCDEQQRSTLVGIQSDGWTLVDGDGRAASLLLDILRTSAGSEGLTRAQLVPVAEERGISRSTVYSTIPALVRRGAIRATGTETRPRYFVTNAYTQASED